MKYLQCLIIALTVGIPSFAHAQTYTVERVIDGKRQWLFGRDFERKLDLPKNIRKNLGLEYDAKEIPIGIHVDINKDQTNDYIVRSNNSLCGTGGCVYQLFDGMTNRSLGMVFGEPIIFSEKLINGFPVIHSYGHLNAASGNYTTFVFNGKEYTVVSSVFLKGESLSNLFKVFKKLPKLASARE